MTKIQRFLVVVAAFLVNLSALAAIHTAMGEFAQREQAAQGGANRIVIVAPQVKVDQFAARACVVPSTL